MKALLFTSFLLTIAVLKNAVAAEQYDWQNRSERSDRIAGIAKRINESKLDVENWPDSMRISIRKALGTNLRMPPKVKPKNASEAIEQHLEYYALPFHLRVFAAHDQAFTRYSFKPDKADDFGVGIFCGLLKPEFIPADTDFRGRAFKDVPRKQLPVDIFLGTTDEPVDFNRFGGRLGTVLVRAEHNWTWIGITVCDSSIPLPKTTPTADQVTALLRKYFRHPLVPWNQNPALDNPDLEILRTDRGIVSGILYIMGKSAIKDPTSVNPVDLNHRSFSYIVVSDGRFIHIAAKMAFTPLSDRPSQW